MAKKMARKGPTTVVYQYLSFPIRVYTVKKRTIKNIYPLVDGKQMRFLESFSTFFTTVRFVVFSGIIVFFVFVNTMSSKMHRGWQNFLANFAWNFQQISFKKGYFLYAGKQNFLSEMAILLIRDMVVERCNG